MQRLIAAVGPWARPMWALRPRQLATPGIVAVVLGLCMLWPAPHLSRLRPPNELVRLYTTRALVDDHTPAIDAQVRRHGQLADGARFDGRLYSDKAPGLSLLGVPVYGLARLFVDAGSLTNATLLRLLRSLLIIIPTALWLWVLGTWLRHLGLSRRLAVAVQIAYALATPAFAYGLKLVGHQAAAWMIGIALAAAWWGRGGKGSWRYLAGLCAGLAAITEYPTLPVAILIGAYALVGAPRPWRGLFYFAAGAALPLAAGALYHTVAFGGPLTTGYEFIINPTFREVHRSGLVGVGLPNPRALLELTIGTQRGLLTLSPWLVLALVGLGDLRSPRRWLVMLLAANLGGLLWVATGFGYWIGGWSVGPRPLVSALPAATVLAALGWQRLIERWRFVDPLIRGFVLAGCVACCATALTLPGFPEELAAPVYELALPLLARLQFSYSLGTTLGLSSTAGMVPVLMAVAGLAIWMAAGLPGRRMGVEAIRSHLWRLGIAGWVAVIFLVGVGLAAPQPSPEAIFRVAWLTQTMWEPRDVDHQLDPRPARWEAAHRALQRKRPEAKHFRALGAVEAYRGEAQRALRDYSLAAFGELPGRGVRGATPTQPEP